MTTFGDVVDAFKKDDIVKIVSTFYENIVKAKTLVRPNHHGTISFCQFVKNAEIKKKKIKRDHLETDLVEIKISGALDDHKLEIMKITDVPGWILSATEGYNLHLIIDNEMVVDYTVNQFDTLIGLSTYIKGEWIDLLSKENKMYKKDTDKEYIKKSTTADLVDPNKFKI